MRRSIGWTIAMTLTACVPQPVQLAPTALHVASAPSAVVQTAASALAARGFEPVTSDATAGVLSMRRERGPHGNADLLTCGVQHGSVADNNMTTTITISLVARPAGTGSAVTMSTHVVATYHTSEARTWGLDDSDTICASNGVMEGQLASALRSPRNISMQSDSL